MKSFTILILVLCFFTQDEIFAQTQVDILQSDRQARVQSDDGPILKLTGNVRLRTSELTIDADSAWHYVDRGEVLGYGNLRIETERELIFADFIRYNINTEISSLTGDVVIHTETAEIYSSEAIYSFISEIALFNNPVWLRDEDGIMQAMEGIYFNQNDSAVFRGNVQLVDSLQYIEADSIFTNRKSGDYALFGNVFLQDDGNHSRLRGDFVEADSTGRRFIEGNAILRRVTNAENAENTAKADTTWLWSDRITITRKDTFNVITAEGNVSLWEIDYASLSGYSLYDEELERIELRETPVVWYQKIELNGDEIDIQLRNDTLRTLTATGSPFAAQQDSLTNRLHQMKGDSLHVFFENDTVEELQLIGNAELLLHATDSDDNPDGAINVRGRLIYIFFEDGQVDRMRVVEGVDGEALEENTQLDSSRLPGFRWTPENRPLKPHIDLSPRLAPIPTEPPFTRTNQN
jgi:lipopolysaccharide export system protein LptA